MFIPEDGTGLPDANSYGTVEDADSYFTLRALNGWSALALEAKQAALVQATDYIEMRFAELFRGERLTETQALAFPRVIPGYSEMPNRLAYATYEYAIRASVSPLAPDPVAGAAVTSTMEKVGPLEEKVVFRPSANTTIRSYPAADIWLNPLLTNIHSNRLIRD